MALAPLLLAPAGVAALGLGWMAVSGRLLWSAPPAKARHVEADPAGLEAVEGFIREHFHTGPRAMLKAGKTRRELLQAKREMFDAFGDAPPIGADWGVEFRPMDAGGVPGEWAVPPGADPGRRLLYLHGGGFTVGGTRSHRPITVALAKALGGAVLAVDYRLMPENKRLDSVDDAVAAHAFAAANGPGGPAPAKTLWVGGDSAGGSLTLALLQLVRNSGGRMPDAAFAFSPATDSTFTGPSIRENFSTDTMIQPLAKPLLDAPRALVPFGVWKQAGTRPTDPRISPLFGKLHNLPPTLIQVSATEMLLDDARRYAARAVAAGSEVELEVWHAPEGAPPLPHVWQIFDIPAARDALERVARFLSAHVQ